MIEDLEYELTGALLKTSNTDNSAMAVYANVDEAITIEAKASNEMKIDLKGEQNTESYKETTNIDIENINKFKKRNKVYTNQWREIYEVIELEFFLEIWYFPDVFLKKCKDCATEAQFVPLEVKNCVKRMAKEQVVYAKFVKLRQKDSKFIVSNKNKN